MPDKKTDQGAVPAPPSGKVRKAAASARGTKRRNGSVRNSYLSLVMIPTLAFGIYNAVATDRYASSASFVVRSASAESGGDLMDNLTGSVSAGSTKSDSYVVRRFLESPDLVRQVDEEFGLFRLFGADRADLGQRLYAWSRFEDKVDYWNRRVSSTYDNTSGILTLEVQAYSAEDANRLADFVMSKVGDLVNQLSFAARESSYAYAREEMEAAEANLREAQEAMRRFRTVNNIADPSLSAGRDDMLAYELNKQIVEQEAALAVLEKNVSREGPNVTGLRDRVEALRAQRDALREDIGQTSAGGIVTAGLMNDYEGLQLDMRVAESRYVSTIEGMENARRDAERQQRYLAVFSDPYPAETAEYPRRVLNTFLLLIGLSVGWAIARLITQMIRDHRQ